jgi:hypothetical protein
MKTKLVTSCFALVVGLLAICSPMFAHHGSAAYESKVTILKNATVTKVNWGNPHTLVLFDAKDEKGEVRHWVLEGGAVSAISTTGWTKNAVEPGDVVTVYIYVAKNGAAVGRTGKVVLADGTELGNGDLFDQTATCDKEFTQGGSSSAACRPDGRKTQISEVDKDAKKDDGKK